MSVDLAIYASVASAAAAIVLVIFGLPPFLRWWRERKHPVAESPTNAFPSPSGVHVHLWSSPPSAQDTASKQIRSTPPAPSSSEAASNKVVSNRLAKSAPPRTRSPPWPKEVALFDGTLEIEAAGYAEVHERLGKGTMIEGMVEEVSGQPFDFYIMDQRNYARFAEDREGTDIYAQAGRVAFNFRKKIPRDGVWYFVFDAYGKQADREVRFELRSVAEE